MDSVTESLQIKIIAVFKLVETQKAVPAIFLKKLADTRLFEVRVEWQSNIPISMLLRKGKSSNIDTWFSEKKTMKTPRQEIKRAENFVKII